jgi:hypothetical protein
MSFFDPHQLTNPWDVNELCGALAPHGFGFAAAYRLGPDLGWKIHLTKGGQSWGSGSGHSLGEAAADAIEYGDARREAQAARRAALAIDRPLPLPPVPLTLKALGLVKKGGG